MNDPFVDEIRQFLPQAVLLDWCGLRQDWHPVIPFADHTDEILEWLRNATQRLDSDLAEA
jgi:hypothetical protein